MIQQRKTIAPAWWLKTIKRRPQPPVSTGADPSAAAFTEEIKQHEPFKDIFDGQKWLNEMLDESVKGFAGR
jgi:hypothetical protein